MKRSIFLFIAFLLSGAAPLLAEEVQIETYSGPATVSVSPETTFVYDMSALDTLDALGVRNIVSISNTYLPYLSGYEGEVGTLFEPDFEVIHAAAPDLVILGGRSMEHLKAVRRIAPAIDMTIWGTGLLEQCLARLEAYGVIYDKPKEAAALRAQLEQALAETTAAVAGKGNALIVMTNGPKISTYGGGSRFGWIHDAVGLPEAVSELEETTHGQAISFEFLRETDPDWLIVVDRVAAIGGDGTTARATLDNPLVRDMRAWQEGRVVYLDAGPIYIAGGGIQSILGTLATVQDAFAAAGRLTD
ncbi:siderophore ABC transporter substrate-binding protein [Puniceibacterium sediminis]|uniref:Iron complex transport system substrate-binding protein n=1 Tax=Puniceibacterium sediminis TaxID=1608407 RepID=A0A238ZQV0_9RHOB|nr:siderophore ABC transporter substrate-binding protein [Puniceibacterium sediminis]SNR85745.1 iron complex transport system substrate-binding protein [Puniceibacterium sediminis]